MYYTKQMNASPKQSAAFFRHSDRGLFFISLALIAISTLLLWAATLQVPDLRSFDKRKVEQSTKIYDRTGKVLLYDLHRNIQRTVIPFVDISRNIKNATVAIEDAEFYHHRGIKPTAILRALLADIITGHLGQGGSTITQQVVKNSLLTNEKNITRKLKEWALSLKLERVLSKEEILALYLNESPYGGSLYGVEEASQTFFGVSAKDVTLAEAAYLAAIPQAPTYYSPYGNNIKKLEERKNLVLEKMLENNFVTKEEYDTAHTEKVVFQPKREHGLLAPHFVIMIRQYLEEKYGEQALEEDGLRVITTLNYDLQQRAEEIVKRNALSNSEKYQAENAALVAIDPKTGQILSLVGSRDYFDTTIDGNFNVALAHRQPGSSFKPFVYATAFKKGYTPETVLFDLKTQFSTSCEPFDLTSESPCYSPSNYDGTFRGPITIRNALAQSINVPAVETLYLAGITDSLRTARDFGIEGLQAATRYGLTLVLGGGEVTPLEMTGAYSVFANRGIKNSITPILRIEDRSGAVREEFSEKSNRVIDENIALQMSDILSDNDARTPIFGAHSPLYFANKDVAVKTGTTNDYRDAWVLGYTPTVAVGVWVGNNDNSPIDKKVAGFIAGPLWHEFMNVAIAAFPEEYFDPPHTTITNTTKPILRGVWQGGQTYFVDSITGGAATPLTPEETRQERVVTSVHSILHWVDTSDPQGPIPTRPENDPQYLHWEYPVRLWATEHGYTDQSSSTTPVGIDTIHTQQNTPHLSVFGLKTLYGAHERATATITASGRYPLSYVEFFLNGIYIGKTSGTFQFSFIPSEIGAIKGTNTLRIVGYDIPLNKGEIQQSFSLQQ